MRHVRPLVTAAVAIWLPLIACQLVFPTELGGGSTDGAAIDATGDVTARGEAAPDSSDGGSAYDGPTVYHDMTSTQYWSIFDMTTVNATAVGFMGGTFDGQNVYFAPTYDGLGAPSGQVARYSTLGIFTAASSWSVFNVSSVNGNAHGFAGATFDGQSVYFAPNQVGLDIFTAASIIARYDTLATFSANSAWSTFDTTTLSDASLVSGFYGSAFDGHYVYFASNISPDYTTGQGSVVARYDTSRSLTQPTSWSTFDTMTLADGGSPIAYEGAVFDGRYVYFVPNEVVHAMPTSSGLVLRYDTAVSFSAATAWSTFNVATLNGEGLARFTGAAFDGHFIYLVPSAGSIVARFDTTLTFTSAAAWSTFDTTSVNPNALGFAGGAFDGRYVYFVPGFGAAAGDAGGATRSVVVRYDTEAAFTTASSWSAFDTTPLTDAGPITFVGAVFDGRNLYLVPFSNGNGYSGTVARFDAKMPPSMPKLPDFFGSFL
jgi:hypothetical protein